MNGSLAAALRGTVWDNEAARNCLSVQSVVTSQQGGSVLGSVE